MLAFSFGRAVQKASRDVALRCAYWRCVRNVSARSMSRQHYSAYLQALYRSPLTDSNRRPLLTMNVRRGSIHAVFRVAVLVAFTRPSPVIGASCKRVRPWCDLR